MFLDDFRPGRAGAAVRRPPSARCVGLPPIRRDLIERHRYLVPNSIVVSRGCPHHCDFCYKDAFFDGGKSFYTQQVDAALAEIDRLPGRHLYFLDDHLFGNRRFAEALFAGMAGMGRVWQAAGTVDAILAPGLLETGGRRPGCAACSSASRRSTRPTCAEQRKRQNVGRDYGAVVRRLHDAGVMVNASFVFGMDGDGPDVFDRTVDWAVDQGIETATFHIMTPYPGTALYRRMDAAGPDRCTRDWDRYDTRHVVYRPLGMTAEQLEDGLLAGVPRLLPLGLDLARRGRRKTGARTALRHLAYAGGWKKFEPLWDVAHPVAVRCCAPCRCWRQP